MAAVAVAGTLLAALAVRSTGAQPVPPAAATLPAADLAPLNIPQLVQQNLQSDERNLNAGATQTERDDAARRLVARQSSIGRQRLIEALVQKNNPGTQLAAARALVDDAAPPTQAIAPLSDLLGTTPLLTEAAAAALVVYRDDLAVNRVVTFAKDPTRLSRAAAIKAMGASSDKRIALALVEMVTDDRDLPTRNAAADALVEMTGLQENGRDPNAWRQWWVANGAKQPDTFRLELLERNRKRRSAAMGDVDGLVASLYRLVDEKAKPQAIRRVLDSPDAPFRAAGVRLVYQTVVATGRFPEGSLLRLQEMIRDSSPEVRLEVAQALGRTNQRGMLAALLAQLVVEPEPAVRGAIAATMVPFRDNRAVPALIRLLDDPSIRVAVVAAETLAKLGPSIRPDAPIAQQVSTTLVRTIGQRGAGDATGDLRAACLEALVPLKDEQQQRLFLNMVNAREPARIRRAGLAGLGELADPKTADAVIGWLPAEQDSTVRVAALDAFKRVGSFGNAEKLFEYTNPAVEPDAAVRAKAWETFDSLLIGGSEQQLSAWADRFSRAKEFDRLVSVLKARLAKEVTHDMQAAALTRESIGEAYMKLSQPQAAIPFFRPALDFWLAKNGGPAVVTPLIRELTEAYLAAKMYPDAARFAEESSTRDPVYQNDTVSRIVNEAERLLGANQVAAAQRLAEEGLKVKGISNNYRQRLQAVQQAPRP